MDWAPWAYQYLLGSLLVVMGVVSGFKNGVWSKTNKRWLIVAIGGFVAMATLQGMFQYWGSS